MPDVNSPKEKKQEQLVRKQGEAYEASYDVLMSEDPHAETAVDDYLVTASFEPAEGMYKFDGGDGLKWVTPTNSQDQHFEVIVRDREDKRFVPYLDISIKLLDEKNEVVAETAVPFIWHPFVYHYGVDSKIPAEGDYTAEVHIRRPEFRRHDEVRGKRYTRDVTVTLGPVHLKPGKKPHGPE